MKIIFCTILFLSFVITLFAGNSDHMPYNSLNETYYSNAKGFLKSKPVDCIFWADKAINESKIAGNNLNLGRSLLIKGKALEQLHQNKVSLKFFHESLNVAQQYKLNDLELNALDELSKLYARTGDYKSAVLYVSLLHNRKDSNAISNQRELVKTLPGKADLQQNEIKMKQLFSDKSVLNNHLRFNLQMIDDQGKWIFIIVIGYGLIFLTFIMFNHQNKLIFLKNKVLTDQMHTLESGKMELENNRYKAEESDRLKTAFLANISHEIRTPLDAIMSFSGSLRLKNKADSERRKCIDIIHQYSESLLSLIKETLEVARIESGELKQEPEMIDINDFLEKIHRQYCQENYQATQKGFKLILNLQATDPTYYMKTFPERLRNIVLHLIENAEEYSENGEVEFGYVMKEPFIEFYVRDNGKGFPNVKVEDIFERFKAVDDLVKPGSGSLGLGLTISKNFVESMGGEIWAQRNNDKGTTFSFTLPLKLKIKQ